MLFEPNRAVRYRPDVEHEESGEEATAEDLCKTMRGISEATFKDTGHAIRAVHAKSHGILEGELEVAPDLHGVLAQGLFARPGRYPVVLRFSTIPGDILDDAVSVPRGLAIKVIGVEGERLPGSEGDVTQDFVLVDGPAFNAPNLKVFGTNLKLLAGSTDKAEGAKKALSAAFQLVEQAVESVGGKSPTLTTLGGHAPTHILGETFYSQAPLLWGDYFGKVCVTPVSDTLRALKDKKIELKDRPHALREEVLAYFAQHGGEWDVRVQLCTDLEKMPVENPHKQWSEDESPYLPVARITVKPQVAWSDARSRAVDDGLSFSPWHGLAAHRPLGSVNRARREAYEMSADYRGRFNGCPISEPRALEALPA